MLGPINHHRNKQTALNSVLVDAKSVLIPEQPDPPSPRSTAIVFNSGPIAGIPMELKPRSQIQLGLKITAPAEAKKGDVLKIHLVQRNRQRQVVGGIAVTEHHIDY